MDYVEAFKNLRTNNKYGRKSPHKAVLMLTVIEMYEKNIITDNEIFYDERLKSMFLKVWNRVLPKETLFHPEAYLPFWYLQNDSFWHIVPIRGKEDILSLMRDTNIKPSEAKLNDSVRYAELDDDLYFLMTIASGRSSLKRTLLETYTNLPEEKVKWYSISLDNTVDHSASAMDEYEHIISTKNSNETVSDKESSTELEKQFKELNDDLQIALSYEYFSFLKNRRSERDMLREVCPNVFALYDCITNHPVQRTDISPSFAFIFDNFLSDLKIALMSENGSMALIDKIETAIEILRGKNVADNTPETEGQIDVKDDREEKDVEPVEDKWKNDSGLEVEHVYLDAQGKVMESPSSTEILPETVGKIEDRKGKPWTENEEELITLYFKQGNNPATIAKLVGRTDVSIKMRLAKLGLIDYTYGQEESPVSGVAESKVESEEHNFTIFNNFVTCRILDKTGEIVFSAEGKLKYIHEKLYRFNFKDECFTVKDMQYKAGSWQKGIKKIVAYPKSELYNVIDEAYDYLNDIEDIEDRPTFEECRIKVNGVWYYYDGSTLESKQKTNDLKFSKNTDDSKDDDFYSQFSVKIGDTLKLFPSQLVGVVINLKLDNKGQKKIIVKSDEGPIVSVYDNKYFYQKIHKKEKKTTPIKKEAKNKSESVYSTPKYNTKVNYGSWILWKPTGDTGKVIGFKTVGSVHKLVLRLKGGSEMEVYDNPRAYDIILV